MPRLLCNHKDCPVHEEVDVPIGVVHATWYCREHSGATVFQPKKSERPQNPPRPKERRDWA